MVVLDLVLRSGSGLEVLQQIKQRASACRVLVFTVHDAPQFRDRCLDAGADGFFSKLRQHLELISLLRELGAAAAASPA
jgi:DNA-binding NarL/FixJ family response regulator